MKKLFHKLLAYNTRPPFHGARCRHSSNMCFYFPSLTCTRVQRAYLYQVPSNFHCDIDLLGEMIRSFRRAGAATDLSGGAVVPIGPSRSGLPSGPDCLMQVCPSPSF